VLYADTIDYTTFNTSTAGGFAHRSPPPPSARTLVSIRLSLSVNAVYADADGTVRSVARHGPHLAWLHSTWSSPIAVLAQRDAPGGGVAIADQSPTQMDVFFVDVSGTLQVAWGASAADSWISPHAISNGNFAPAGALLATGMQGTQLDVFVVGNDGNIKGFHVANNGTWACSR